MHKNNQTQGKISFWQKIVLMLFGLLLAVIILEIGLRLGGFIVLSLQEHRNRFSIQKKGTYRIICLGESTTAGQYPPFLEESLNQRKIGIKFSVIDKGITGTRTGIIVSQLEANLDKYQPDLVVTMMGINDRHIKYYEDISDANTVFFNKCRTYRLTRILWMHIVNKARKKVIYKPVADEAGIKLQSNLFVTGIKEVHAEQKKSNQADELFKKVIESNQINDEAYIKLGNSYKEQGQFIQAEECFKKAIELNPKNDRAYVELGNFYRDQGIIIEAEQSFKKAIELNPKSDQAYVELGDFYRGQGKLAEAEQVYKKAIELNSKNDWVYLTLGWLYRDQGRIIEAEQVYKKAIELNPKNDRAYVELGWFYKIQGRLIEAEQVYKKAIELNPKNEWVYLGLAIVYDEMGNHKLFKECREKANRVRKEYYIPVTINNYRKLKQILDRRKVRLVCVQYPMRSIEPLKKIFAGQEGIIFVDNEKLFKGALRKGSHEEYFTDMFGGDFGHCSKRGNRLLAENIANVILKECFNK